MFITCFLYHNRMQVLNVKLFIKQKKKEKLFQSYKNDLAQFYETVKLFKCLGLLYNFLYISLFIFIFLHFK